MDNGPGGGGNGNSNEPLLQDAVDDDVDVEGFGFSIGNVAGAPIAPDGPPIRPVLDGIALPTLGAGSSFRPLGDPLARVGAAPNANEPHVVDCDG